jgi:hypothetical protein
MEAGGTTRRDLSVSLGTATLLSLVTGFVPGLLLLFLFTLIHDAPSTMRGLDLFFSLAILLPALILGVVVHELLHAAGWMIWGKKRWQAITFGIKWQWLAPYAHCTEPMPARAYRWSTFLPGLLLGIVPGLLALLGGSGLLAAFAFFFIAAAGGDFLVLWLIRGVPATVLVEDHPERAGCYVWEEKGEASGT